MGAYEEKIAKRLEEHEKKLADRQAAHEAKLEARIKAQEDKSASKTNSEEQAQLYGGAFDTNQRTVLDALILLVRTQNPCVGFTYSDAEREIQVWDFLETQGMVVSANLGGWIPEHNGFITGYGIVTYEQFVAGQGLRFRVYRDGVVSTCTFIVTNVDNKTNPSGNAGGAVKARLFNTIPYKRDPTDDTQRYVYPFKAGEKITIATETIAMPNFTDSPDIYNLIVWLYYVFSVPTEETLNAQNYGGGSPGDIPGGGGGDTGGGIIIV